MKNSLLYKLAILLSLMVFSTIGASAQRLTDYTAKVTLETWQPIIGSTICPAGDDNRTTYPNYATAPAYQLPFPFKYDDQIFNYIDVSDNGWIRFLKVQSIPNYTFVNYILNPGGVSDTNTIAFFNYDNYTTSPITCDVQGTSPNRVFVIQWTGIGALGSYSQMAGSAQIRLYESSNTIKIVYGPGFDANASVDARAQIAMLEGKNPERYYINIEPQANASAIFHYNNSTTRYITTSPTNLRQYLNSGLTYTFSTYPSISNLSPSKDAPLSLGGIYGGTQQPGFEMSNIQPSSPACYVRYQIAGPDDKSNPDYKVIYDALIEGGSDADTLLSVTGNGLTQITEAKGIAARRSDGALDLSTNQSQIPPGKYYITATLIMPSVGQRVISTQRIYVAYPRDIAVSGITSPKATKYALSRGQVNVSAQFTNRGAAAIPRFNATATITDASTGAVVYTSSATWANQLNPLTIGNSVNVSFDPFPFPSKAGSFNVVVTVSLPDGSTDYDLSSNVYPESGDAAYTFTTLYESEPRADFVVQPTGTHYVGVPIRPTVQFTNTGMGDMTNIKVYLKIDKYPSGDNVYPTTLYTMPDLPNGQANYGIWPEFIPPIEGQYKVTAWVVYADDPEPDNNTCSAIFTVNSPLNGTYTIGTKYAGQTRNYNTIHDAIDALYLLGVSGPVVFQLTDSQYQEGNIDDIFHPAIDLSSTVIGMSATNTVTFTTDRERGQSYGGAEIVMNSGNGVGMLIGQNNQPNNTYASVYQVRTSRIREYSNSLGFFSFDGGKNKSLKFTLNTNQNYRAAIYLSNGASNNTIKNCIIADGNLANPSTANSLPLTKYNLGQNKFEFDNDNRSDGSTYTSGIVLRSIPPMDVKLGGANTYNLDTVYCANNLISTNDISGFSYGISSMGVGPLYNQYVGSYYRYYNKGNKFANNKIFNVGRTGIFLGFCESDTVKNNRIYTVGGISGKESAGIILGGEGRTGFYPYNNLNMVVDGNEISDVTSTVCANGIKVEQSKNAYPFGDLFKYFPDAVENSTVMNNIVWGLKSNNTSASKFGIRLFTTRATSGASYSEFLAPVTNTYFSSNDKVVNNTVYIVSDSPVQSSGMLAGIAIQNVKNAQVKNNAIAFLDADVSTNSPLASCIFYQGLFPSEAGFASDRNAFQIADGSLASVYGFVQTDDHSRYLEGTRDDYKTIYQWQQWSKQDFNSVIGNFTQDLAFSGLAPTQKLRIIADPLPLGSILNNRGERLALEPTDIDGVYRGQGGQRYDIGACEFFGRLYTEDLSVENISAPGNYRAYSGTFSDAEYVMTTPPVNVTALIRNNGATARNLVNATLRVRIQNPDNSWNQIGEMTQIFSADPSATAEVTFPLQNLVGATVPESYRTLINRGLAYQVPSQFLPMQANVSPVYEFEVLLNFTELKNDNNSLSKRIRFYIPADNLNMLVSAENTLAGISSSSTHDLIAGRLNYDSLASGLKKLGWYSNINEHQKDTLVYDVFDRTGWEPKAVDYSMYHTMFWSDGDDKPISRYQRSNIRGFLNTSTTDKRNLIIGSQDIVRQLLVIDTIGMHLTPTQYDAYAESQRIYKDSSFCYDILQAVTNYPTNPLGYNVTNHGNQIIGVAIGKNFIEDISRTGFSGDAEPYCANLATSTGGEGLASIAYKWKKYNKSSYYGWAVGSYGTVIDITADTVNVNPTYAPSTIYKKFNSVSFANASYGWMVGEQGAIAKTIDGGKNWTLQSSGTQNELYSVSFTDNLNGWAVGEKGTLARTENGGTTWTTNIMGDNLNLNAVSFINQDLGFMGGSMGRMTRIKNNGTLWEQMTTNTTQTIFGIGYADEQHIWAACGGGVILSTSNQGSTWSTQATGVTSALYGISFFNQNVGWAVGANGTILRTINGGANWSVVTSPVADQLNAVFATDSLGAVVLGKNGIFMNTTDAGAHWNQFNTLTSQTLYGICMLDNNNSNMGISSTSQTKNSVVLGADWRHFKNNERLFRSIYDFVIKNNGSFVPVELTDFEANLIGKKVELDWTTASELNTSHFEIEKSTVNNAGISTFKTIAQIDAAGKSNTAKYYGPVVDENISSGTTYIYRLKMVDLDGQYKYSDQVTVNVGEGVNDYTFGLDNPVPNPANNKVDMTYNLDKDSYVTISLYDMAGNLIRTIVDGNMKSGKQELHFNVGDLSDGTYNLILATGNNKDIKQIHVVR